MEGDPSTQIFFFVILLLLSGLFSGAETAFFSINNVIFDKLSHEDSKSSKRVIRLLSKPRRLLITILIGNTLVNVSAVSLSVILVTRFCRQIGISQEVGVIINVVVVTFLILVISEISPKIYAVKKSESVARYVAPFIQFFLYFFYPFSFVIDHTISLIARIFKVKEAEEENLLKISEFQTLLELGAEQGELELEEQRMIHSIFEFGDTIVREIMIPRPDMICVPNIATIDELIDVVKERGHTRIPVYKGSIDDIQGIINAKDLLPFISNSNRTVDLLSLARPALFVPETKKIDDLLRLFQKERQHMVIVVDEYGGTSGIVTLEDVLEEIVGEIRDEYDQEQNLYRKLDEESYLINAKIDIESLNEVIDINIPIEDDYDTLGGFIFHLIGAVPEKDQVVEYGNFDLIVKEVKSNRIIQVKITQKNAKEANPTAEE